MARCLSWRSNPNFALAIVTVALFLDYLLLLAMVPILPSYAESLGLSPLETGLLFSIKPIAGVLASPLMGLLSDRIGRRLPMIIGLFGAAAFTLLFAYSATFWQLFFSRLLQGVASSSNTAAFALLTDVFPDSKERGSKMSIAITGISMGVLCGPIFGGLLYEAGGVSLPFVIGAGLLVLDGIGRVLVIEPPSSKTHTAAILTVTGESIAATGKEFSPSLGTLADSGAILSRHESEASLSPALQDDTVALQINASPYHGEAAFAGSDTARKSSSDEKVGLAASMSSADGSIEAATTPASAAPQSPPAAITYLQVLANRRVITLCLALLVGNGAIALMEVVLPLYLTDHLGLSPGGIGGLYAGGNALYVIITIPAARMGARIGRWKLITLGCVLMGVPMPMMAAVVSLWWVVPLWLVCSGLGMSLIDTSCSPELSDIADEDLPGAAGRVFGLAHAATALGFIAGPLIGTALVQAFPTTFHPAFASLGIVVLCFAPVVVWGFRGHLHPQHKVAPESSDQSTG